MVKGTNTGVYIYSYIRPLLHGLYMEKGIVPMGTITGYSQKIQLGTRKSTWFVEDIPKGYSRLGKEDPDFYLQNKSSQQVRYYELFRIE